MKKSKNKFNHFQLKDLTFNDNSKSISNNEFYIHNRRYLGSKYKLLGFIEMVSNNINKHIESVADIFAGTGIVADYFNNLDKKIIVNDILRSNFLIYTAFFSDINVNLTKMNNIIKEFNSIQVIEENYFSKNFGGSFFSVENAKKIGYIREKISEMENLNFREESILITSLLYATDKVANTCGHYDAYRRKLDTNNEIKLLMPKIYFNNSSNEIYNEDANKIVKSIETDLVYIDPPYNSRQYGDTYHLLENLAEWKKPDLIGVAKKMKDRSKIKSKYCTIKAPVTFKELIKSINAKYILVSYNNMEQKGVGRSNAKISYEEILNILQNKGSVKVFDCNYKAYTTGKSNISDHKELLYLCEVG
jgi:adenine-specific DNA-methyltransferase